MKSVLIKTLELRAQRSPRTALTAFLKSGSKKDWNRFTRWFQICPNLSHDLGSEPMVPVQYDFFDFFYFLLSQNLVLETRFCIFSLIHSSEPTEPKSKSILGEGKINDSSVFNKSF